MLSPLQFWARLDKAKKGSLKEICAISGVRYDRVLHNRSDCRYPNLQDVVMICEATGISMDYLCFDRRAHDSGLGEIISLLREADAQTVEKVRALLVAGNSGRS